MQQQGGKHKHKAAVLETHTLVPNLGSVVTRKAD